MYLFRLLLEPRLFVIASWEGDYLPVLEGRGRIASSLCTPNCAENTD